MNIRKLTLLDFMSHPHSVIELPEKGIVLITGENGAGKSTVVESVAWGLWGKTLRGGNPSPCSVELETSIVNVSRSRSAKGRMHLDFTVPDIKETEFDTKTKAQEALNAIVGDFEIWQKTRVLSSRDAVHFTLARDGDRKKLLENILNLGKFDEALKACRDDVKVGTQKITVVQQKIQTVEIRLEAAERRMSDANDRLVQIHEGTESALGGNLADLQDEYNQFKEDAKAAQELADEEQEKASQARSSQVTLKRELASIKGDDCPTCGQKWPDFESRRKKRDELRAELAKIIVPKAGEARQKLESLRLKIDAKRSQILKIRAKQEAASKQADLIEQLRKDAEDAIDEIDTLSVELDELQEQESAYGLELAELKACEKALGLRGVRSHVLAKALGGIENIANNFLSRMQLARGPIQLALSAQKSKKDGSVADILDIQLEGAGGGDGYKGASGGERRRIDVALLLALMEVAGATYSHSTGTMFFDEVFDSLDKIGTRAAIETMEELAKDRTVVVISHSDDLVDELNPHLHLHVSQGKVERR